MDFKQQLLEDPPPSLELVGYGPHLRWLMRNPDAEKPGELPRCYSPHWPFSKVTFRTVDDFSGEEDWEWLLRYRGFESLGERVVSILDVSGS